MFKSNSLNKQNLCNVGNKWSELEEMLLIDELSENKSIDEIAKNHGRTVCGINARCKDIAYKLYRQNKPIEEITTTTKLSEIDIINHIKTCQYKSKTLSDKKTQNIQIDDIKNDINQIKKSLKEIFGMIQAIYEFEEH